MHKVTAALSALTVGVALAGCGSIVIDGTKAEHQIRTLVTSKLHLPVKSVRCPSDRPAKKGQSFTCTMVLANGESEPFRITPTNDKGTVSILPASMLATYVQETIVQRLGARGIKATAACPQHVPIVVGAKLTCAIRASTGQRGVVSATIHSTDGGFVLGRVRAG